mmetsp:Transcript_19666/g.58304  ORF Transcript_19666/g.58304 Transcript_19666/m.58304 type:complete len:224 (-) Transcript_19666:12-683(-)
MGGGRARELVQAARARALLVRQLLWRRRAGEGPRRLLAALAAVWARRARVPLRAPLDERPGRAGAAQVHAGQGAAALLAHVLDAAQIAGSGALHRRVPLRRVGRAGRRVARAVGRRAAQLQGAGRNGARRRARHGIHQAATKLGLLLERVLRRPQRTSPYAQPIVQFFRPARGRAGVSADFACGGLDSIYSSVASLRTATTPRRRRGERVLAAQLSAICIKAF